MKIRRLKRKSNLAYRSVRINSQDQSIFARGLSAEERGNRQDIAPEKVCVDTGALLEKPLSRDD